eukprot:jgi/Psemu1/300281/fgenesh1_kg.9_\
MTRRQHRARFPQLSETSKPSSTVFFSQLQYSRLQRQLVNSYCGGDDGIGLMELEEVVHRGVRSSRSTAVNKQHR